MTQKYPICSETIKPNRMKTKKITFSGCQVSCLWWQFAAMANSFPFSAASSRVIDLIQKMMTMATMMTTRTMSMMTLATTMLMTMTTKPPIS